MGFTVAIVGCPNVGKSTLFNRIVGQRISITDDKPGVTRDRIYARAEWLTFPFNLIDTGGIDIKDVPFLEQIREQVNIAIDEADCIIFVVDGLRGLTNSDQMIASMLYDVGKPVVLAVNKIDDLVHVANSYEFYALGFDEPIAVSANHGIGIGDLLDKVLTYRNEKKEIEYSEDTIKFAIVGRPNVGKSSLVNAILQENRAVVSSEANTTTDSVDTSFKRNNQEYVVIDTAGIKKRGRIYENLDKYSLLRTTLALERADIALLVLDGEEGIVEQDKNVGGYIVDSGKACIIVVNKWDLVEKDDKTMEKMRKFIKQEFQFLAHCPIVFTSALNEDRINTIFKELLYVHENYSKELKTSTLNALLQDAVISNPPPMFNSGRPKFNYVTQIGIKPPTFVFKVNNPKFIHFSYERHLKNVWRNNIDYTGSPLKFIFRSDTDE